MPQILLEGMQLSYIDKVYDGENPFELGIELQGETVDPLTREPVNVKYFLFEVLERCVELARHAGKKPVYFGYHITAEPMTWDQATTLNINKTMGLPISVTAYHAYSDLTGYLWTTVRAENKEGHDVYQAILSDVERCQRQSEQVYITLLCRVGDCDE